MLTAPPKWVSPETGLGPRGLAFSWAACAWMGDTLAEPGPLRLSSLCPSAVPVDGTWLSWNPSSSGPCAPGPSLWMGPV
jgi:hypothetical protein